MAIKLLHGNSVIHEGSTGRRNQETVTASYSGKMTDEAGSLY